MTNEMLRRVKVVTRKISLFHGPHVTRPRGALTQSTIIVSGRWARATRTTTERVVSPRSGLSDGNESRVLETYIERRVHVTVTLCV